MQNNGSLGFKSQLDARLARIAAECLIAPTRTREAHFVVVGEPVGHKIKRLYTLQKMLDSECEKIAAKGDKEAFEMKVDFCDIVGRILRHEVWCQYPALARKPFILCSDWTLCWEKEAEAENSNFSFRPVGLGDITGTTVVN